MKVHPILLIILIFLANSSQSDQNVNETKIPVKILRQIFVSFNSLFCGNNYEQKLEKSLYFNKTFLEVNANSKCSQSFTKLFLKSNEEWVLESESSFREALYNIIYIYTRLVKKEECKAGKCL